MDRLGLPYANGFSGVIERRFNPATFRYALAEQLNLTSRKWSADDGSVYVCKLHGSITWTEDAHGLFPSRELWPTHAPFKVMIFRHRRSRTPASARPTWIYSGNSDRALCVNRAC